MWAICRERGDRPLRETEQVVSTGQVVLSTYPILTTSSLITEAFLALVKGRSSESSNDDHTSLPPLTNSVAIALKDSAGSRKSSSSLIDGVEDTAIFSWLSAAVRVREQLNFDGAIFMNTIKHKVLSEFFLGRLVSPPIQSATIRLRWNPRRFIKEQGYRAGETLSTALTISGNAASPQLLTAMQYLEQTWPLVGPSILQLVMENCTELKPAESISSRSHNGWVSREGAQLRIRTTPLTGCFFRDPVRWGYSYDVNFQNGTY